MTINIAGLDKAAVLATLYNHSRQQGLGFLHTRSALPMSDDQAAAELNANPHGYFDYLHGRVMKVDLTGEELDPRLYDRDNGAGAAARAIGQLQRAAA
jgi:hypothetical protein